MRHRRALGGRPRIAFRQRLCVLAEGERARLIDDSLQFLLLEIGRQLLVVPRIGRVGLNERLVRDVVVGRGRERLVCEQGRNQNDAAQLDSVPRLQFPRQASRPDGAVALADEELRRQPPVVGDQIGVDELAERAQIAVLAVEL